MKDYANLPFFDGVSFPTITAKVSTGSTTKDGTPFNKQWADEVMGSFQALLLSAQLTPSGASESATASQILESIQRISGEPGEVYFWAGSSNTSVPFIARSLQLKGQVISISGYPDLVENTYIGDGNNADADYPAFYKSSDSAGLIRSTSGTYFKLPDARGHFLRVLTDNRSDGLEDAERVAAGNQYIQASLQDQWAGDHEHGVMSLSTAGGFVANETVYVRDTDPGDAFNWSPYSFARVDPSATAQISALRATEIIGETGAAGETELRPPNMAMRLMIRY